MGLILFKKYKVCCGYDFISSSTTNYHMSPWLLNMMSIPYEKWTCCAVNFSIFRRRIFHATRLKCHIKRFTKLNRTIIVEFIVEKKTFFFIKNFHPSHNKKYDFPPSLLLRSSQLSHSSPVFLSIWPFFFTIHM